MGEGGRGMPGDGKEGAEATARIIKPTAAIWPPCAANQWRRGGRREAHLPSPEAPSWPELCLRACCHSCGLNPSLLPVLRRRRPCALAWRKLAALKVEEACPSGALPPADMAHRPQIYSDEGAQDLSGVTSPGPGRGVGGAVRLCIVH